MRQCACDDEQANSLEMTNAHDGADPDLCTVTAYGVVATAVCVALNFDLLSRMFVTSVLIVRLLIGFNAAVPVLFRPDVVQ